MRHYSLTLCTSICLLLPLACDRTDVSNRELTTASVATAVASARPADVGLQVPEGNSQQAPSRTLLPPNPATLGATLGRTFQGELVADVTLPGKPQPASLRYAASGDRMRMRFEGGPRDFDLIADGKALMVLDHKQNTYRKFDLTKVSDKPADDSAPDLKVTEDKKVVTSHAGLRCEERTIRGEQTDIQACISAIPGTFERAVFEQATGIKLPAWLAALVDEEEIPLRAKGHQPGTTGEFALVVTRFSPEVPSEEAFTVPADYRVQQK